MIICVIVVILSFSQFSDIYRSVIQSASGKASPMASTSEEDFMRVLEEMNRLCGDGEPDPKDAISDEQDTNNDSSEDNDASKISNHDPILTPTESNEAASDDPLDELFATNEKNSTNSVTSNARLIGDQLLSSTVGGKSRSKTSPGSGMMLNSHLNNSNSSTSPLSNGGSLLNVSNGSSSGSSRSRHCSANSNKSCVSFDSAIGDVYSVQTPTKGNPGMPILGGVSSNNHPVSHDFDHPVSQPTASAGIQFDNLAASVCFDSGEPSADLLAFDKDVEGLGGISLRLVGSEDVDLVGTSFSLALNNEEDTVLNNNKKRPAPADLADDALSGSFDQGPDFLTSSSMDLLTGSHAKKKRCLGSGSISNNSSSNHVIVKSKPPTLLTPQLMHERQEVERICLDLLRRFQHACAVHPKTQAKVWMAKSAGTEDPLLITTRLITDSLARLRIFVHSLDPMNWLMYTDRHLLYSYNVCILSVFKAAVSVNLEAVPMAYPLPYGEYLGEVEALHLILAHDLYNELRGLLSHIQSLGIREFPVMLLVMMIAFFSPQPGLKQPDKVVRINDYYMHKLQVRGLLVIEGSFFIHMRV